MDVIHCVLDYSSNLFETLEGAHYRDGVAVHHYVSLSEELERFERRAVLAEDSLASLDEALLVADHGADLDDVAGHAVFEDLDRLRGGDRAGEELDEVSGVEDRCGVVGLETTKLVSIRNWYNAEKVCLLLLLLLLRRTFLVVLTVMEPSIRSRIASMPYFSSAFVTSGQESLRYRSRYLGKRVMKEDSSRNAPDDSSLVKGSIFHLSMSSVSHGFSFLWVEGILSRVVNFDFRYRLDDYWRSWVSRITGMRSRMKLEKLTFIFIFFWMDFVG